MSIKIKSANLSLCRICLNAKCNKDGVKFEVESEWSRIFEYCVGLTITAEKAPLEFCGVCAKKLQDYVKFKKLCLKSEKLWKSISYEVTCNVEKYESNIDVKDEPMNVEYLSDHSYHDEDFHPTNDIPLKLNDNSITKYYVNLESECEVKKETVENEGLIQNLKDEQDEKYYEETSKVGSRSMSKRIANLNEKKTKVKRKYTLKRRKRRNCPKKTKLDKPIPSLTPKPDAEVTIKSAKLPKVVEPASFNCGNCDFISTEFESLKKHFSKHFENNDLSCKLCDYVGRDLADMAQHRYKHILSTDGKSFYCPTCSRRFNKTIGLQFHYRAVHLKKKGGLCRVCNKSLATYRAWKRHERQHLVGLEKYICDLCGMECQYRCSIIAHLRGHENVKDFICDTCGRGFKRMTNLRSHIENVHTPSVPVLCTHCNRMFKNEANLKIHMRQESLEKKYICDVCAKGYTSVAKLKSHMFWHTGERPFACEVCGTKFKAKSQLKVHMRSHSGYKPYKCMLCDRGFTSSNLLKRHQSVHTGVRRVKCLYCDRTFHAKSLMVAHCASRHKVTGLDIKLDS